MLKFDTVIFDWDGTLAKTLHLWLAGYREGLKNQNHSFLDSVIANDFFYEHDRAQEKYPAIDLTRLLTDARDFVRGHLHTLELYSGVQETIDILSRENFKIALVSSSPRQILEEGLAANNLTGYFLSIIAGDDVTKHKPHPEAFTQTMINIDSDSENTLIIGDAMTDILAGKSAEISTCLFAPPENSIFYNFEEIRTVQPDFEITKIKGLLDILI